MRPLAWPVGSFSGMATLQHPTVQILSKEVLIQKVLGRSEMLHFNRLLGDHASLGRDKAAGATLVGRFLFLPQPVSQQGHSASNPSCLLLHHGSNARTFWGRVPMSLSLY